MSPIHKLSLRDARPDNQVHLLLWDQPTKAELKDLVFYNDADWVNYRENLLQRLAPNTQFLTLQFHLERELTALETLCQQSQKSMVLLEGLDCLITYLHISSESPIALFWHYLENLRKLERLLWILLPSRLKPPHWPETRLYSLNL